MLPVTDTKASKTEKLMLHNDIRSHSIIKNLMKILYTLASSFHFVSTSNPEEYSPQLNENGTCDPHGT
ncbi:hypothetical protein WN48_00887 [Eufriesea mexicana]|nr:hypothetical protein WN48_00887 [Eufriesea mexicana]